MLIGSYGSHGSAKHTLYKRLLISSVFGGIAQCALLVTAAHAQSSNAIAAPDDAGSNQVEQLVVTAERREETVANVPISITAISGVTIQKFDIQDFADYAQGVPNLSFGMGVSGSTGAYSSQGIAGTGGFTIRGISGADTTAFYIDDTPLPDGVDPRIIDIDHIEVLRGPQGALFGAASMGGLIRIITQQPNPDKFSATVDLQGYDMDHSSSPGGEASAVVNLPLAPNLASVRLSAFDSFQPGYFTRTYDDPLALDVTGQYVPGPAKTVRNVGSQSQQGFGATFLLTPIPNLEVTELTRFQQTRWDGFPLADYYSPAAGGPGSFADGLVQRRILNFGESASYQFFFTALTAAYTTPFGRFVSSTSWFTSESFQLEDGSDANSAYLTSLVYPGPGTTNAHNQTFTEEDRFESNFNFPVQAVGGVFYQLVNTWALNDVWDPALLTIGNPYGTQTIWQGIGQERTQQLAGYLDLTYTPIKPLEISVGGRESLLTNYVYANAGGIFGTGLSPTVSVSQPAFTPRFAVKYRFDPGLMVYATAAQGFRVGGSNPPLGAACTPQANALGLSTTEQYPYGSDDLWSFEGGVKTTFLNNRVSFNGDIYQIDWNKIQQVESIGSGANGCFEALTLNLGSALSQGVEADADLHLVDHLTLHLAGGYENARLTTVVAGTAFHVGEALSGVPKWTASASLDYEIPEDWGQYFLRAQYSYTGESVSYDQLTTGLVRNPYSLVNLRLGADIHSYEVTLFAKNLFDAKPDLSDEGPVTALVETPTVNRDRVWIGPPREIGVDFRYKFQ
jgi:outer membrane receptor protein involved in Fe transport